MDSRQRGRDIEDILTPKHLPECNVYFGDNKKKKNGILAKLVRITAIAASLAAVTFIISKVDFISQGTFSKTGDNFYCHHWDIAIGIKWVEARNAVHYPTDAHQGTYNQELSV